MDVQNILRKAFEAAGVDWYIRGIVDSRNKIYTVPDDAGFISKVFDLVAFPIITKALEPYVQSWETEERQNYYPDFTLITSDGSPKNKIAIDVKSTARKGGTARFSLGTYNTYMRYPFTKNIRYPYPQYTDHWIVGFIYDRIPGVKSGITDINSVDKIVVPIKNIEVVIWQKWQIASDRPMKGDIASVCSVHFLEALRKGKGLFTQFGDQGKDIFEDYWRYFDLRSPRKYNDLEDYFAWKK